MSLFKRFGTDGIQFVAEIHLRKLCLNLNSPDILVTILVQRGERKVTTKQPALLSNKIAFFNDILELPITLYYERKKQNYQDKLGSIYVLLQCARGTKKAGELQINFADFVLQHNSDGAYPLERCIDKEAKLYFDIVMTQVKPKSPVINQKQAYIQQPSSTSIYLPPKAKHSQQQIKVTPPDDLSEEDQSKKVFRSTDEIPAAILKKKQDPKKPDKKKTVGFDDERSSGKKSSDDLARQPSFSDKLNQGNYDFSSIGSHETPDEERKFDKDEQIKILKEEVKYMTIKSGQLINEVKKGTVQINELTELVNSQNIQISTLKKEKSEIERLFQVSQQENRDLTAKLNKQGDPDMLASRAPSDSSEYLNLQNENKRLLNIVNKLRKENEILQSQLEENIPGPEQFQWFEDGKQSRKQSNSDQKKKIEELEQKLAEFSMGTGSENQLAKLSIENEALKRKLNELSDKNQREIMKMQEEQVENFNETLRNYTDQIRQLTPFKEKFMDLNQILRKTQDDLQAMQVNKFQLEVKNENLESKYSELEEKVIELKGGIARAMTEFMNYGDTYVVEIMEQHCLINSQF